MKLLKKASKLKNSKSVETATRIQKDRKSAKKSINIPEKIRLA